MGVETLDDSLRQELPPQEITEITPLLFIQQVENVVVKESDMEEELVRFAFRDREEAHLHSGEPVQLPFLIKGISYTAKPNGYPWSEEVFNKSVKIVRRENMQIRSFGVEVFYLNREGNKEIDEVYTTIDSEEVEYADFFERAKDEFPEFFSSIELDIAA